MRRVVAVALGSIRRDRVAALVLVITIAVVTTGVGAAAEWAQERRASAFTASLDEAADRSLEFRIRSTGLIEVGDDPVASISSMVVERSLELPEAIADALDDPQVVIDTNRFEVIELGGTVPASPTLLTLRTQSGLDSRSTVVRGRRAEPVEVETGDEPAAHIEIEIGEESAVELGVDVGDRLLLQVSLDDALARRARSLPDPFEAEVVGVIALSPSTDAVWFDDDRLHRPILVDTAIGADRLVTVAVSPAALATAPFLQSGAAPFAAEWRSRFLSSSVALEDEPALRRAVRLLETETTRTAAGDEVGLTTDVGSVLLDAGDLQDALAAVTGLLVGIVAAAGGLLAGVVATVRDRQLTAHRATLRMRGLGRRTAAASAGVASAVLGSVGALLGLAGAAVTSSVDADAGVASAWSVALAIAVLLTAFSTVLGAAVASGVDQVVADGVPLLRTSGGARRRPLARSVVDGIVAVGMVVVVASWWGRDGGAWDRLVDVVVLAPAGVFVLLVRRGPPGDLSRWVGASSAVLGVTAVAGLALFDVPTGDALGDTVRSMSITAGILSITVAFVTGLVTAGSPGRAPVVHEPIPSRVGAERWRPLRSAVVGAVAAVGWLAVLVRAAPSRIDVGRELLDPSSSPFVVLVAVVPAFALAAGAHAGAVVSRRHRHRSPNHSAPGERPSEGARR